MPQVATILKAVGAVTVAGTGLALMASGEIAAVGIGSFCVVHAFMIIGALVWA